MARARMLFLGVLGALFLFTSAAMAQEGGGWRGRSEVSVQGTGFFTKDSVGNGLDQHSTNTGGFLLSYRYHFYRWLAADASYGYAQDTQQNFTSVGDLDVRTRVHQVTGALVANVPWSVFRLKPFVLAGAGALIFNPNGNPGALAGLSNQTKPAFVYGGGVDYKIVSHVALRVEYRGFVYNRPDFGLAALQPNPTTHTAQPSAGLVFQF